MASISAPASVEFESTLEEQVDAEMLALRQSGQLRRGMMYNAIIAAVVTGAIFYIIIPDTISVRLAFGGLIALVVLLLAPSVYKRSMRRNLTRVCADLRGTCGPIHNRVDIDKSGIQITWCDSVLRTAWRRVRVIDQAPRAIHVSSDSGVAIVIPNRTFENEKARQEFLDAMHALREESGGQWSKVGHRACGVCGYDLHGSGGDRCPECGDLLASQLQTQERAS